MEKYGFVYIWYDKKRKMYYIGCHWGTEDDGYICSSPRMKNAYNKRPQDFKRRIIEKFDDKNEMLINENKWLSLIGKDNLGKKYYNLRDCLFNHWSVEEKNAVKIKKTISERTKEGMSTPEARENFLAGRKKAAKKLKGRKRPNEIGKKISESKLKKFQEKRDNNLPCFSDKAAENLKNASLKRRGTKLSEEHKEKIGNAAKSLWQTSEYKNDVSKGLKKAWAEKSDEEKKELGKKISEGLKGKQNRLGQKNTPEHNEKIRQKNSGKQRTPEHNEKIRQKNLGKKRTEEFKRKKSEQTKLWWSKRRAEKLENASDKN